MLATRAGVPLSASLGPASSTVPRRLRLHPAMVNREADRQRSEQSTIVMAGNVGNLSLRTDAEWAMIGGWTTPDRARTRIAGPRQIAILVYPGVQSLDVTGPLEVFAGAQRLIEATGRRERGYEVQLLSVDGRPLQTSSGLTVTPHASLARCARARSTR